MILDGQNFKIGQNSRLAKISPSNLFKFEFRNKKDCLELGHCNQLGLGTLFREIIQGGLCSNHKKGEIFCCENHRTYDDVIIIKPEAALHWLKKWKPIDALLRGE